MTCTKSKNCLTDNLLGINHIDIALKEHINTPPYSIKLEAPQCSLTCTDYDGEASNTCTAYYMFTVILMGFMTSMFLEVCNKLALNNISGGA